MQAPEAVSSSTCCYASSYTCSSSLCHPRCHLPCRLLPAGHSSPAHCHSLQEVARPKHRLTLLLPASRALLSVAPVPVVVVVQAGVQWGQAQLVAYALQQLQQGPQHGGVVLRGGLRCSQEGLYVDTGAAGARCWCRWCSLWLRVCAAGAVTQPCDELAGLPLPLAKGSAQQASGEEVGAGAGQLVARYWRRDTLRAGQ